MEEFRPIEKSKLELDMSYTFGKYPRSCELDKSGLLSRHIGKYL